MEIIFIVWLVSFIVIGFSGYQFGVSVGILREMKHQHKERLKELDLFIKNLEDLRDKMVKFARLYKSSTKEVEVLKRKLKTIKK